MDDAKVEWSFLTNHALVLVYLKANPKEPLRRVATAVGITERAVQRIVAELEEAGCLERTKVGRQNTYSFQSRCPLRHPLESHRTVGELLDWVADDESELDLFEDYKGLDNWKVGEHGSEVRGHRPGER